MKLTLPGATISAAVVCWLLQVALVHCACNISKYKGDWSEIDYEGNLRFDPDFWRYQTQQQFLLSNELALQLSYGLCKASMESLIIWKAGRHGPVDDITTYDVMCSKFCLENDILHQNAMEYTGCSCLELSSQPGDSSYIVEGDWCTHNTARMQCDILGFCGFWECRIDDFMCPRYEYNKRFITYAGPGHCSAAPPSFERHLSTVFASAIAAVFASFWLLQD